MCDGHSHLVRQAYERRDGKVLSTCLDRLAILQRNPKDPLGKLLLRQPSADSNLGDAAADILEDATGILHPVENLCDSPS
jgi:hypothetical protein